MKPTNYSVLAVLTLLLLPGCSHQHFRAETTWLAGGRVERATSQPGKFFPEDSKRAWEAVQPTNEISVDEFQSSIRDHEAATGEDATYLVAWGTFLSPRAVPESLRFLAADPSKAGRLERTTAVNRLGFVTEYVWEESLTDVVSLADMQVARREAATLVADLVETTLESGELSYDISALLTWLRTDAAAWFDESHAAFVEAAIRREVVEDGEVILRERLASIAEKYGLDLRNEKGELIDDNLDRLLYAFLVQKVRETVRTPQGEPIDESSARRLLSRIGLTKSDGRLSFEPSAEWQQAVLRRFGSEEGAKAKWAELFTRLVGAYQAGFLMPRQSFRYEMSLPGTVVETTGERTGKSRVIWRFDAAEAFPFGYMMSVRSLAPNEAQQKAILGEFRLDTAEEMTEYVRLLKSDEELAEVMEQSVESGSLQPLDDYTETVEVDVERAPVVQSLRKLLGL